MTTIATHAGFSLGETAGGIGYESVNRHADQKSGVFRPTFSLLEGVIENPYVGLSAAFLMLCGAVVTVAMAFTGSL